MTDLYFVDANVLFYYRDLSEDEKQQRYGTPWWDALVVAAAWETGCAYILSEDFQPGKKFGHVRVVNPFRSLPTDIS